MQLRKLRAAVVGMGKMGLLHASILNVIQPVQVAAVCEKSFLTRRILKRFFKTALLVNNVEKLSALDLDMVYVTTPIPSHYPILKTLYQEEIVDNVFVEKTLASTFPQSKTLHELAADSGGVNMVGYLRRYAVTFQKAKELVAKCVMGEPESFGAYAYSSDFCGADKGSVSSVSRGGVLRDLGCHIIDLALWLFGDLKVEKRSFESFEASSGDAVSFAVRGSNDLNGAFDVSWCVEHYRMPEVGLRIKCSEGSIEVNDDVVETRREGISNKWYRHDLCDSAAFWLGAPEYFREDDHFVKCALGGRKADPDFLTASKVDEMIEEVCG